MHSPLLLWKTEHTFRSGKETKQPRLVLTNEQQMHERQRQLIQIADARFVDFVNENKNFLEHGNQPDVYLHPVFQTFGS